MLKRRLCEARFEWQLCCPGPLLIGDGRYKKNTQSPKKTQLPDQLFVSRASEEEMQAAVEQRPAATLGLQFYVPGTSLRGPLRAHAERILRTLPGGSACDPFEEEDLPSRSCSRRLDMTREPVPYAAVCQACKLFGCTATASRIEIADAEVTGGRSVYRDMIGIDRFTGGAYSGAKMRFHVLEGASFQTTVVVRNFELWQLGLLAYTWRDFAEGLVTIGFGKSKGFGQVSGKVTSVHLTYPAGVEIGEGKLHHLGSLCKEDERNMYGLKAVPAPACALDRCGEAGFGGLYTTYNVRELPELTASTGFWALSAAALRNQVVAAA